MAITRFLNRLRPQEPYPAVPTPKHPVCVIGDIHGRADLFDALVRQLCSEPMLEWTRVVLVGDLIDRGPDSVGVLNRVRDWCSAPEPFASVTCLMGNHERMMLDFLADPIRHGPRWLGNGGDTTLESYGLSTHRRPPEASPDEVLTSLRDALVRALPDGLHDWLLSLPLIWQEDRLVVTHAGADPARPMDEQMDETCLWGHRHFRSRPRSDGLWIVHGHIITRTPSVQGGRIAVDTGAWRSGCLTAAIMDETGPRFVSTDPPKAA